MLRAADLHADVSMARLMTVARADGNNDAKRVAYLQVEGTSRFEAFDIYWPLFFPWSAPLVTLRVRGPEGTRVQTVSVPPVSYADRVASIEAAAGTSAVKDAPIWEFRLLDDRTGFLRMPSWALYNSAWNWRAFPAETFERLVTSGATDLVVDLRGNEGGSDVGDVIVSHLITTPVPRQAVTRLVRYRTVPDDLAPYLDTWDASFRNWGAAAIDSTVRFYRLRRDADDDLGGVITPALPRFAGRLWVLVGATSSSATFEFAQTVRQNHLGTLVGQPTGGIQRGINGGAFFFVRLPRSGLELDLPLIGQFPDGDRPDPGCSLTSRLSQPSVTSPGGATSSWTPCGLEYGGQCNSHQGSRPDDHHQRVTGTRAGEGSILRRGNAVRARSLAALAALIADTREHRVDAGDRGRTRGDDRPAGSEGDEKEWTMTTNEARELVAYRILGECPGVRRRGRLV